MNSQHETLAIKIKTYTAFYVAGNRVDSTSTLGGQKTNNWLRTLREVINSKYNSPTIDVVKKIEIEICR